MITTTYEYLTNSQAIYTTYEKCCRKRPPTQEQMQYEHNIFHKRMNPQTKLRNYTYQMSDLRRFIIKEPKPHKITILLFPNKIVQRLICENPPYLETHNIYNSAACKKGKGEPLTIQRLIKPSHTYNRQYGNKGRALKGDIKNFYSSSDIEMVKRMWFPIIVDNNLRKMTEQFLNISFNGFAMGNQLSTIFILYYLNTINRYIKAAYRIKNYSHYVDDFICIEKENQELQKLNIYTLLENALTNEESYHEDTYIVSAFDEDGKKLSSEKNLLNSLNDPTKPDARFMLTSPLLSDHVKDKKRREYSGYMTYTGKSMEKM